MLNASTERLKEIEVLDAMCGTGKTYNVFKSIVETPHERILYATPMLTEATFRPAIELAKFEDCGIEFHSPQEKGNRTKSEHLVTLLEEGKNVSCTHNLLLRLGYAGQEAINHYGYKLIIDEEPGMIAAPNGSILPSADKEQLLAKNIITTDETGRVIWLDQQWGTDGSKFGQARAMAEAGSLYLDKSGTYLNEQVPTALLHAAKRVILATYMFEGSIFQAFLKTKGIGHKPFAFNGLALGNEDELKAALRERIRFVGEPRDARKLYSELEGLSTKKTSRCTPFSFSWYQGANQRQLTRVGNHIRSMARRMHATVDDLIYTLPSEQAGKRGDTWIKGGKKLVKVPSYSAEHCFLHKGERATNNYAHKTAAIHAYDRYVHPAITRYLGDHGAPVDHDSFALAELIQWLFRTAIRREDGPMVQIHIASQRMDELFKNWLYH